jgi:hypothetical protein
MSTTVETPAQKRNWTDAEFMALAEDGQRYEIVNGELLTIGNSGALHGYLCSTILAVLWNYNLSHKQGLYLTPVLPLISKMVTNDRPIFPSLPRND